jgi:hypothetical protein
VKKLERHDVRHGVIQAGLEDLLRPMERVQVASIQTLTARAVRTDRMQLPPADMVVIDEAHHVVAETYRKIIELYPNAILLGLTATPCRADGRGLGGVFNVLIEAPQVPALIKLGYLVPTKDGHNFESSKRLIECTQCSAIRKAGEPCPYCGFLPKRQAQPFCVHDGDLGLVTDGRAGETIYDDATKRQWWAMLTHIAQERGYKQSWPSVNYKQKFGDYPGPYGATIKPEEPRPRSGRGFARA